MLQKMTKEKKSLCKMTNMVLWTPLASVLLAFSVIPCFRSLPLISPLHRSSFPLSSLLLSASVSVSLSLRLSRLSVSVLPSASLPSPARLPCPLRLDQRWRLQPLGSPLAPVSRGLWAAGGRAAPPRSCSLGSGDAPCMSPHPWIVTTRNNRNKVNKSEK